jgi:hypothetical protein
MTELCQREIHSQRLQGVGVIAVGGNGSQRFSVALVIDYRNARMAINTSKYVMLTS